MNNSEVKAMKLNPENGILIRLENPEFIESTWKKDEIYFSPLSIFKELEEIENDMARGDKDEGSVDLAQDQTTTIFVKTKNMQYPIPLRVKKAALGLKYPERWGIACFFFFPFTKNCFKSTFNENDNKTVLDFTDEVIKDFAKFQLEISEAGEQSKRQILVFSVPTIFTESVMSSKDFYIQHDEIRYYDPLKSFDVMSEANDDPLKLAFFKRDKYAYQHEYRIITELDGPDYKGKKLHFDHLSENMGIISDIDDLAKLSLIMPGKVELS